MGNALELALEQLLDDMGAEGHCVCEAAKQQAIAALKEAITKTGGAEACIDEIDAMSQQDLDLCTRRYIEQQAAPSMIGWRSLAYMAALKADTLQDADPHSETGEAIRVIAEMAWENYIALSPKRDAGYFNGLAGVVVGWFGKFRRTA